MRYLLFVIASLMLCSLSAQNRTLDVAQPLPKKVANVIAQDAVQEMQMHPGNQDGAGAKPLRSGSCRPFYRRPAGAFYCTNFVEDGCIFSLQPGFDFLMLKPFSDYSFSSVVDDYYKDFTLVWVYDQWSENQHVAGSDLIASYDIEIVDSPTLYSYKESNPDEFTCFQFPYFFDDSPEFFPNKPCARIYSIPTHNIFTDGENLDFLLSSKTMCEGGREGNLTTRFLSYTGPVPFGDNLSGWWFGKNGGHVDGIAQAFEKPEHPYLLTGVHMVIGHVNCIAPAQLTCKVYRLEEIPQYDEEGVVTLSSQPGELIANGRATVTPSSLEMSGNLVSFMLYEEVDGLEIEYVPAIDFPILVVVDGYNDPEADGLVEFTAFASADIHSDEGYGELAYLKCPVKDEQGDFIEEYLWKGLNNYFSIGEMKTGLSIFITAELPYLVFRYDDEDGQYIFPKEGGLMEKQIGDSTTRSIEFYSWEPSRYDAWSVSCNGHDLPDWLDIKLYDGQQYGEFNYMVTAVVTAEPMPFGINYREAVVRFEFPSAYIDYKFIQHEQKPFNPCDNPDGELNVADVNLMIHFLLEDMYDDCMDLNEDGELSIADVNLLIDLILKN